MAKGLGSGGRGDVAVEAARQLQRLKCGNLFRALQLVRGPGGGPPTRRGRSRAAETAASDPEFDGYLRSNGAWISNYGERHRNRETISSAFVESTINQVVSKRMVKRQQMRWTGPTCCSTTSSRPPSAAGFRGSITSSTAGSWPRDLPRFAPVSTSWGAGSEIPALVLPLLPDRPGGGAAQPLSRLSSSTLSEAMERSWR